MWNKKNFQVTNGYVQLNYEIQEVNYRTQVNKNEKWLSGCGLAAFPTPPN